MTDRELAIIHLVLGDAETIEDCKHQLKHWRKHIDSMLQEEHCGDCTNQPCACSRCIAEEAYSMAPIYRYLFGL